MFGPGRWDRRERELRAIPSAKRQFRVRPSCPAPPPPSPASLAPQTLGVATSWLRGPAWRLRRPPRWSGCRLAPNPRSECCHRGDGSLKIACIQPEKVQSLTSFVATSERRILISAGNASGGGLRADPGWGAQEGVLDDWFGSRTSHWPPALLSLGGECSRLRPSPCR